MRDRVTWVSRNAPLCARCGVPCHQAVTYTKCQDAVDVLMVGSYCSTDCLLWRRDDALLLIPTKSKLRRWGRGTK